MEQIGKKNQLTQHQRIQIFGKVVAPDLREKVQSLEDQISNYTKRIGVKMFMLESVGILSLEDLDSQSLTDLPAFVYLRRNEEAIEFGKEIIDIFFGSEVEKLKKERNRVRHSIDLIEWKPNSIRHSSRLTIREIEIAREFSLEELVGAYIKLRRSGTKTMSGRCPFHNDKTPSFVIYGNSNRFICFGCGEKGDAISFLMKIQALNFKTTIRTLTALSGSEVKTVDL